MNILVPVPDSADRLRVSAASAALTWRDGAIIKAVVAARSQHGLTELMVGRTPVKARGGDHLVPGQTLTLRVSVSRNMVLLRPVSDPATEAMRGAMRGAIRQALPVQSGQPALLANLEMLTRAPVETAGKMPIPSIARSLLDTLPTANAVSRAATLRQAIMQSGLFLESRLAAGTAANPVTALSGDWKAALLKAADALATLRNATAAGTPAPQVAGAGRPTSSPPPPPLRDGALMPQSRSLPSLEGADRVTTLTGLSTQLAGVIARLTLTQLASLPADTVHPDAWLLELPVRNANGKTDVFGFRFEREPRRADAAETGWTARLAFDFPATGPVQARITLRGREVTTVFHATRPQTVERLRAAMDELAGRFGRQGLGVASLTCVCGEPAGTQTDPPPGRLLETRA